MAADWSLTTQILATPTRWVAGCFALAAELLEPARAGEPSEPTRPEPISNPKPVSQSSPEAPEPRPPNLSKTHRPSPPPPQGADSQPPAPRILALPRTPDTAFVFFEGLDDSPKGVRALRVRNRRAGAIAQRLIPLPPLATEHYLTGLAAGHCFEICLGYLQGPTFHPETAEETLALPAEPRVSSAQPGPVREPEPTASPPPLALILPLHLPWLPQGRAANQDERRWTFGLLTQTLIPLLDGVRQLQRDKTALQITLALSPTLLSVLGEPRLALRYRRALEKEIQRLETCARNKAASKAERDRASLLRERLKQTRRSFCEHHGEHLLSSLREFARAGQVELATSPATLTCLPLQGAVSALVQTQIDVGVEEFQRQLGLDSKGMWLPRASYSPELEPMLRRAGLEWIAAENPSRCGGSEVWETASGLTLLLPDTTLSAPARNTPADEGGPTGAAPTSQARAFLQACRATAAVTLPRPRATVVTLASPLLGTSRMPDVSWLLELCRQSSSDGSSLLRCTPSTLPPASLASMETAVPIRHAAPANDYASFSMGENSWLHRPIYRAARRLQELARRHPDARGLTLRALNQAVREMLLAQASDWPLLMRHELGGDYAIDRVRAHLADFEALADQLDADRIDRGELERIEERDGVFAALDYRDLPELIAAQ